MNKFSQLFNDLDESTKTNDRLDHLVKYLIESAPEDSIWVCWFLAGNRIKGAIKTSELRTFASERSGLPLWLLEECYDRVEDLAETIFEHMMESFKDLTSAEETLVYECACDEAVKRVSS